MGEQKDMAIGNLESQEKGTAARANADKPQWSYMPLQQVVDLMTVLEHSTSPPSLFHLVQALAKFQQYGTKQAAFAVLEWGTRFLMNATASDFNGAMCHVIKVWKLGEEKYARYNWMKGMPWSEPINSAQRHIMHMYNGEQLDQDSGQHHAAHFVCNAMMMVHYVEYYPEGNDLPVKWFE